MRRRLLPSVVELQPKGFVVVYFVELAPLRGWLSQLAVVLGPPAFGGRYVPQLAIRSALRRLCRLGLALRATAAHR